MWNPHCFPHIGCLGCPVTGALKDLLPVLFLGKVPSSLIRLFLSWFCPQQSPKWGTVWAAPPLRPELGTAPHSLSHLASSRPGCGLTLFKTRTEPGLFSLKARACSGTPVCCVQVSVWACSCVRAGCVQGGGPLAGKPTNVLRSVSTLY